MPSLKCSIIFVFLLSLSSSLFTFTSAANPKFLDYSCSGKNFTRNSTYQSNINLLLSSLPSDANSSHKFSNATAGQDPDRVYGLFQCRGDVSTTTCQDCVTLASTRATQLCPDQKGAIIWYDECLFRYSDSYIFSTAAHNPGIVLNNDTNVKREPSQFFELVLRLMNEAAAEAANDPKKFATREGNSTASQPVYVLVQCTQDLSNDDCSGCLRESIANLQSGRLGASSFLPSCNSRYESYLFYNENLTILLPPQGKGQISSSLIKAIVAPITVFAVLFVVGYCFLTRRARRKKYNTLPDEMAGNDITSIETLQFDFGTIEAATNRFSMDNKLGEGGFGEVYKGVLPNGQVVAIKRLSKSSGQGEEEFKSEVVLVAKLHHKNLVRLMGFCLEKKERILVYEFVSNKSLDYILFDPEKQGQLDWSQRYKIIGGIARGILYLHEDSRLRIIHRDLKASNILLDGDMNPKISDFGMAKICGVDQTQGKTRRIKGTYGYMSPEYAMRGQFSVKSDVYSFGVLVLEIITGKKNSNFYQTNGIGDLLSLVWKHWREETPMLLLDPTLTDSYSRNEVMRCIHMGLLCVQENPTARPTMATIDLLLNSHSVTLPVPKQPAFLFAENFTRNSTYQSNLNFLLSSLATNANSSDGFSNATAGQDPNRVYGLFQCRGDVTASTCRDCVAFGSGEVTQRCPAQKGAVIWYDECLLHYNASDFFSTAVLRPRVMLYNTNNVTIQPDRFHQIMLSLMNESATQAANDPKRFGTRKGDSTTSQTLYTLAQCTRDLSSTNCFGCLQEAISILPNVSIGGRRLLPSCHCRYEIYPFYAENETLSPAPTPSPPPPVTRPEGKSRISSSIIVAIVVPVTVFVLLFVAAGYCFLTRRAKKKYNAVPEKIAGSDVSTIEALQYDFGTIQAATKEFSTENKLGEGGFGEVYKGVLSNGQMIAVKRLSKNSGQGAEQFKNEVVLVAKLQHRNLVRLLGFCLEGEEKILVYEFVPNKSLDYFLFDPEKQRQLDWSRRYKIIEGIARGILYLHEDSRLKIIHRDLKTSNVLLDSDMNPKISDFGMARIFGVDQTQGNTSRVVGTYGYMSPEYAMQGLFSVKSDVYSFGVLVLEIITGKKNSSFYQTDGVGDLLSYAWKHWREETPLELLDSTLTDSYSKDEVIRCIQLALLCVQEDPDARPTMANVILMLNSYSITLQSPQQPAFFLGTGTDLSMQFTKETESDQSKSKSVPWSVDDASITEVYPR